MSNDSTSPSLTDSRMLWVVAPCRHFQVTMDARGLHCMSEGFVKLRLGQCSPVGFGAITHNGWRYAVVAELSN
jgi:hypothetical protein